MTLWFQVLKYTQGKQKVNRQNLQLPLTHIHKKGKYWTSSAQALAIKLSVQRVNVFSKHNRSQETYSLRIYDEDEDFASGEYMSLYIETDESLSTDIVKEILNYLSERNRKP